VGDALKGIRWHPSVLFTVLLNLAACNTVNPAVKPTIAFTKVPPFQDGSSDKLDVIEGKATGARPGQRVVLYAQSGEWWVQPYATDPFTPVQPDSTWKSRTHPGLAYAALLVGPNYYPNPRSDMLPTEGNGVLAVATIRHPDVPPAVGQTTAFSGYDWHIRQAQSDPGGTPNDYNSSNVFTDARGFLHLRISGSPEHWMGSEVNLLRSLGYGSYRFVVRDLSQLEPAAVFTMCTRDDDGPSREMDVEISKWGETFTKTGQFVIQPYHIPSNSVQFDAPAGPVTFMVRWSPRRAEFRAYRGATSNWDSPTIRSHVFTSGVPPAGNDLVHLNFYVFGNHSNPLRRGGEVVVELFEYLP
jgi:hypothetical protein